MRPAAPSRKALALAALETGGLLLGSGSGDKGRQPIDAGIIRNHRLRLRLRLRLKLRLRTMFAMAAMFA